MKEFSLRKATEEDFTRIKELIREGQINPMGLDWDRFIVAVTDTDEVIGCAQIKPHRDGSQELASLVVTESWQGRGVAKKLMNSLIESHNGDLYLMCQSSLGPFYQQFDFVSVEENEMPKYFRRISKLVSFVEPLTKRGETLLVMIHKS